MEGGKLTHRLIEIWPKMIQDALISREWGMFIRENQPKLIQLSYAILLRPMRKDYSKEGIDLSSATGNWFIKVNLELSWPKEESLTHFERSDSKFIQSDRKWRKLTQGDPYRLESWFDRKFTGKLTQVKKCKIADLWRKSGPKSRSDLDWPERGNWSKLTQIDPSSAKDKVHRRWLKRTFS
jgi:hypothetical protein